ncbi:MAG: hypothetical protein Alpg2KO_07760 [Alphaproteobacteria bacterium]
MKINDNLTKDQLLAPRQTPKGPMSPFALKEVWENIEEFQAHFTKKGEPLTFDDLRKINPSDDSTFLYTAAKMGKLDTVLAWGDASTLTTEDFTRKNKFGRSVLDELTSMRKLDTVFKAEFWTGRVGDMQKLWQRVPAHAHRHFNYREVLADANRRSIRQFIETGTPKSDRVRILRPGKPARRKVAAPRP